MTAVPIGVRWFLDSGASKHFTGVLSDLSNFKSWNGPRPVRIANGSVANAIGYGRAMVGEMVLSEVWFVPTFGTTRLLLVSALDNEGYSVLFSKGKATCIKDNVQYFKAPLYNEVYMVEEQARSASAITNDLRSMSHDISIPPNISINTTNTKESLADLWHRRLAHTNHNDIQRL
jgi:hypothetical protein